ncbi:hypothetical protein ACEQPO_19825 [Bacillus sp. SL00103]
MVSSCLIGLLFTRFVLVETKGRSLEQIETDMAKTSIKKTLYPMWIEGSSCRQTLAFVVSPACWCSRMSIRSAPVLVLPRLQRFLSR